MKTSELMAPPNPEGEEELSNRQPELMEPLGQNVFIEAAVIRPTWMTGNLHTHTLTVKTSVEPS